MRLLRGIFQFVSCFQGLTVVFRGFFEILFHAFASVVTFTEAEERIRHSAFGRLGKVLHGFGVIGIRHAVREDHPCDIGQSIGISKIRRFLVVFKGFGVIRLCAQALFI